MVPKRDDTSAPASLFFAAGEPSGDLHAAHLMDALRTLLPDLRFRGFGGPRMVEAGLDQLEDLPSQAVMGLFPVIAKLPEIRRWFRMAEESLRNDPPRALVLVDYPGFNMRLARKARALGIPVIYYIAPQVWAWNRRRVHALRELVDLLIVILPFEEPFFRDRDLPVFYPGHPVIDRIAEAGIDEDLVAELRGLGDPVVSLFPGSRAHVVESLLPSFLGAARRLRGRPGFEDVAYVVAAADERLGERLRDDPRLRDLGARVVVGRPLEAIRAADLCLTTSGTTTIEIAAHEKPMVLAYKVSPIFWALGRALVRVPHIGLVNLIAGRGIVPERIGVRALDRVLADDLARLRNDESYRTKMIAGLAEVRRSLETPGSYARAAARIAEFLGERGEEAQPRRAAASDS